MELVIFVFLSIGLAGALFVWLGCLWVVFRPCLKGRPPLGRRSLKHISRVAPMLLIRAHMRQDFIARVWYTFSMVSLDRTCWALCGLWATSHRSNKLLFFGFGAIALDIHAPNLALCRLMSSYMFYASCPSLRSHARVLAGILGFLMPLFAPKKKYSKQRWDRVLQRPRKLQIYTVLQSTSSHSVVFS